MELGDNEAHIFQIPIPEELSSVGEDYDILIEITLSYAANPRRTRRHIKGYLSTWLDWCCSRIGESAETFAQRIFETWFCRWILKKKRDTTERLVYHQI